MGWTGSGRRWTAGLAAVLAAGGLVVAVTAPDASAQQAPIVTVADTSVAKPQTGTAEMPFTLRLTAPAVAPVQVSYQTFDDNAIDGRDYTGRNGTVTFQPGSQTITVPVDVLANTLVTGNRDFRFNITSVRGGTANRTNAYGYVIDTSAPAYVSAKDAAAVVDLGQTATLAFPVVLDKASPNTVSVRYSTSNGNALAGRDYTATSGVLTFAPGVTSQTVNVPVVGTTPGGRLGFNLDIADAGNATVVNGRVYGYITVDDRKPYFSVDDTAVTRPATGGTNVAMTVRLLQPLPYDATVNYRTVNGAAISGTDYNAVSGTLTFAAGATTQTVTVRVLAGAAGRRDLTLRLDTPSAGGDVRHNGTLWVQDAASRPQLTVNDTGIARPASGSATATFTIGVNPAPTGNVVVNYGTADGSAVAGTDYTATSGTVTFTAGQRTKTVSVPVTGRTTPVGDEVFYLNVSSPDADVSRSQGHDIVTTPLASQQTPVVSVLGTGATVPTSGSATADFQVYLATPSANTVTVNYSTFDGSAHAGVDYGTTTGTATFAPGVTSVTVSVPLIDYVVATADRYLYLQLSAPTNAVISSGYYQYLQLHHTPTQPVVSVSDTSAFVNPAGPAKIRFAVRIPAPSTNDVTVNFATSDGSATSTTDYIARSGTLVIPAGATVRYVDVTVRPAVAAGGPKNFYLFISNPLNAYITTNNAQGILLNGLPQPYLSVTGTSLVTGASATTAKFGVVLSTPTSAPVTVNYQTENDSAVAGVQYTATSGSVTIPAGQTTANVSVPVAADTSSVDPTRFYLRLTGAANATVGGQYYGYAILEHTTVRSRISGGDVVVVRQTSGAKNAVVTLRLSPTSTAPVTVDYGTADGSGVNGTDYTATTGTATFAPGASTATVTIPVLAQPAATPDRNFYLYLGNATGPASINRNPSYIQIESPTAPTTYLTVDDTTASTTTSGTANATFALHLQPAPTSPVNVVYNTRDNDAVAGRDYTPVQGTVTFAAGQDTATVTVPLLAKPQASNDNSFFLDAGIASGAAAVQRGTGLAIVGNPVPGAYLQAGPDVTVVRGTTGSQQVTITASLTPAQTVPVSVRYATVDQNAVAGRDYVATSGVLTFAPGQTTKSFTVTVLGATNIFSNLGFYVQFADPQGANLGAIEDSRTNVGLDAVSTFAITGTAVDTAGAPLAGATITRTGGNQPSASTTTAADGTYSIANSGTGTFTVSASLAGYSFQPPSATVVVNGNDPTVVDFVGYQGNGLLAQAIASDGTPLAGITITRTGGSQPTRTATTNSGGYVAFASVPNGTYTLTASGGGASAWVPASFSVTIAGASAPNHQFVKATGRYASGRVVDGTATPVAGVRVTRSGPVQVSTSVDGYYVFPDLPNGSYTITPSRTGKTFTPATRTATISNSNATGLDFTMS